MIRRPPRSTLFPTRRSSDLTLRGARPECRFRSTGRPEKGGRARTTTTHRRHAGTNGRNRNGEARSEEHTSELQSRQYLVCRLLLEKKKNKHISITQHLSAFH